MSEEKEKKRGIFRRIFGRDKAAEEETPEPEAEEVPSEEEEEIEERGEIPAGGAEEVPEEAEPEPPPPWQAEEPEAAEETEKKKRSFFGLVRGLGKTRSGFVQNIDELMVNKTELDAATMSQIEEILVTSDIGVKTAFNLLQNITDKVKRQEISDPSEVMEHLKAEVLDVLLQVEEPLRLGFGPDPLVVMVVGVNGSGKTTTIAKIAARHKGAGGKVMMAAGDTFRAAAVEQMEIWAERVGCPVVKGKDKADPSSVVFDAMEQALREDMHLVLVDTAGRLHTRVPLMEQMKKMSRTMGKKISGAPHEILLVIDASMGQNAILQAKTFNEALPVTGLALTKLDGTAKGGVLVGISDELKIPVRYIGIGEKMDDLRDFNARDFVEALFAGTEAGVPID